MNNKTFAGSIAAGLLLIATPAALATTDIAPATPGEDQAAPLSWLSRVVIDNYLAFDAYTGTRSGYVAMFSRDGQLVHSTTAGFADIATQQPMTLETQFRIASMTKPVTAVAALLLVEEGKLRLDDPVSRYIPAAAQLRVLASQDVSQDKGEDGHWRTEPLQAPLTVRQLLTFSAGLGYFQDSEIGQTLNDYSIYEGDGELEQRIDRLLQAPLLEQPGQTWRYGYAADVLARVVEVAADEPFDQFLQRRIFSPLGMNHTHYQTEQQPGEKLATLYTQDENQALVSVDKLNYASSGWTPGGDGLLSTAGDYMRFALMLWNQGSYDGVQILKPETVQMMTQAHVPSGVLKDQGIDGLGWGLGLAVVVDAEASVMSDYPGDFFWSGYYGTTFFVSPQTGLVGVVLSQNQPSDYSDLPVALYLSQAIAFFGL